MKVTIVGAGNVGATCADVISYRGIASEVVLDIKKALPKESVDIMQCATNTGFNTRVSGVTNDYETADSNGSYYLWYSKKTRDDS
jgi:malate dehydrogenase